MQDTTFFVIAKVKPTTQTQILSFEVFFPILHPLLNSANMKKLIPYLLLTGLLFTGCKSGKIDKEAGVSVTVSPVAFYNIENLFDTIDQDNVNDLEFTPVGSMKWGTMKYT